MKKIVLTAFILLALFSCAKVTTETSSNEMSFNFFLPTETKATASAFESDDALSLYAVEYEEGKRMPLQIGGNWLNNEKLTYNGSTWSSTHSLYWGKAACDFYAFYPYQASIGSMEKYHFSVAENQDLVREGTTLGGYEASDLMYASAVSVSRAAGSVNLTFHHMMSKLVVRVIKGPNFEGDIPDDISAHVYNTVTDCYVDWTKGSVEKDAVGAKTTLTMKKIDNTRFEAVLVPQNIEKRTPLIELTMGGIAYLLEYSLSFRPGYVHYVDLTVNTSPDQEQIEIVINADPGNWG